MEGVNFTLHIKQNEDRKKIIMFLEKYLCKQNQHLEDHGITVWIMESKKLIRMIYDPEDLYEKLNKK